MNILLTNDDGIFAPGLAALFKELTRLGTVFVVAPAAEQSGVSQSLTFRHPILVKDVLVQDRRWGWGVEGTPADCVKVGVNVICPQKPDLVVSGINWGQNCGTNILYSGTLGAALEGGLYNIPSFAVSIQDDERPNFERAAEIACQLIEQMMARIQAEPQKLDPCGNPVPMVCNINVSREAVKQENPIVEVCPMDTTPYANQMQGGTDTFGRAYYWLSPNSRSRRPDCATDMNGMGAGKVTVTPLRLDLTDRSRLNEMQTWNLEAPAVSFSSSSSSSSSSEMRNPAAENASGDLSCIPNLSMRTIKNHDIHREA